VTWIDKGRARIAHDPDCVENRSPSLDPKISAMTVAVVSSGKDAW
jgi:hypothetical protein